MKALNKESTWRKQVALDAIEALAHTIDAKDVYTKGHSIRVAKMSVCIARKMNIPEDKLEILYYIGLMHDVGKVGVPDHILNKPSRLTDEEYAIMKQHPEIGHIILSSIRSIPHLEDGVNYHHEKYDGSGYPKGLKGKEIPLIGRIICCVDCYDAMARHRGCCPGCRALRGAWLSVLH